MIDSTFVHSRPQRIDAGSRGVETDADAEIDVQCLLATIALTGLSMLFVIVLCIATLDSIVLV